MGGYFSSLRAGTERLKEEIRYDPQDPDAAIQAIIDNPGLDGFQWRVWWVAASGFFTTSYSIFSVNVIGPAINYVYPEHVCQMGPGSSFAINLSTLTGTIIGALVFGYLADRHGRKAVYGLELAIVVIATIGMTTASSGRNSMNVYGWIIAWRLLLGIGLGAEYPLSALVAIEWSSTRSRARMMAAVFLMQAAGQLAAYGFGLAILAGVSRSLQLLPNDNYETASPKIDAIWRIIVGVGAFPALISLILRRTMPETPYYLVETGRIAEAVKAAGRVYAPERTLHPVESQEVISPCQSVVNEPTEKLAELKKSLWRRMVSYGSEVKNHLSQKGRWRALLGVMLAWYLLDVAYYGLGLDNPKILSKIWLSGNPPEAPFLLQCTENSTLRVDPIGTDSTIYSLLYDNIRRDIITISSGTLPGSIIILLAIDYVPRATWMAWMFVTLAGIFAINGGSFFVVFESEKHALTITLYVLAQVVFNLGPNTMTFILPAELFVTKYRGTFYGLAAAAGKLGAITILCILNFGVYKNGTIENAPKFGGTLLGFTPAMLLGALITWVWIPEVQFPRGHRNEIIRDEMASDNGDSDPREPTFRQQLKLPNRPLAHIAQNPGEGQILGLRRNLRRLFRYHKEENRKAETDSLMENGASGVSDQGSPSRTNSSAAQHYFERRADVDAGDLGIRV